MYRTYHFQSRHSNGAGSSHQYAVGCADAGADGGGADAGADSGGGGAGANAEGRSSLWQITNDAELEVIVLIISISIKVSISICMKYHVAIKVPLS